MRKLVTSFVLIVSNLVPLFGVIFFSWDLQLILILYWIENVMIGVITVMKMRIAKKPIKLGGDAGFKWRIDRKYSLREKNIALSKIYGFFMGLFIIAHGLILYLLFLRSYKINIEIFFPIIVLLANHIFSYLYNFIGQRQYLNISADKLFKDPNLRIRLAILHFTIVISSFIILKTGGQNIWLLTVLIIVKTFFQLATYLIGNKELNMETNFGTYNSP